MKYLWLVAWLELAGAGDAGIALRQCVLHAGEANRHSSSSGVVSGQCSYNAECGVPGTPSEFDGDVDLDCSQANECRCTVHRAQGGRQSFSFRITQPCTSAEAAEHLLRSHCFAGHLKADGGLP